MPNRNGLLDTMSTIVGEVAETARSLTTAAREIASGNMDLGEPPPASACQLAAMCAANPRHRARQRPLR
jgi:methyl-accepting chemotaxis protein